SVPSACGRGPEKARWWKSMSRFRGDCPAWWVAASLSTELLRTALLGTALLVSCQGATPTAPTEIPPEQTPSNADPQMTPAVPVMPSGAFSTDGTKVVPGAAEARLLTRLQYDNTVRDLLGELSVPAPHFPET